MFLQSSHTRSRNTNANTYTHTPTHASLTYCRFGAKQFNKYFSHWPWDSVPSPFYHHTMTFITISTSEYRFQNFFSSNFFRFWKLIWFSFKRLSLANPIYVLHIHHSLSVQSILCLFSLSIVRWYLWRIHLESLEHTHTRHSTHTTQNLWFPQYLISKPTQF